MLKSETFWQTCLNPYSTGSNSNTDELTSGKPLCPPSLNPYSTGSNSNTDELTSGKPLCPPSLNPYSTGSNSNKQME